MKYHRLVNIQTWFQPNLLALLGKKDTVCQALFKIRSFRTVYTFVQLLNKSVTKSNKHLTPG